jgi:hypothetical protein
MELLRETKTDLREQRTELREVRVQLISVKSQISSEKMTLQQVFTQAAKEDVGATLHAPPSDTKSVQSRGITAVRRARMRAASGQIGWSLRRMGRLWL